MLAATAHPNNIILVHKVLRILNREATRDSNWRRGRLVKERAQMKVSLGLSPATSDLTGVKLKRDTKLHPRYR